MKIEYNTTNKNITIKWTYKLVSGQHKIKDYEITLYHITLNQDLKKLAGIRNTLFIYYHEPTQKHYLTTLEPPEETQYEFIKPRHNKRQNQTYIKIPHKLCKQDKDQEVTITYHSNKQDYINPTQQLLELTIHDPLEQTPTNATINTPQQYISWTQTITDKIPYELLQILNKDNLTINIDQDYDIYLTDKLKDLNGTYPITENNLKPLQTLCEDYNIPIKETDEIEIILYLIAQDDETKQIEIRLGE